VGRLGVVAGIAVGLPSVPRGPLRIAVGVNGFRPCVRRLRGQGQRCPSALVVHADQIGQQFDRRLRRAPQRVLPRSGGLLGAADADPIIRKALALGGDEAIRVNTDSHDSFVIASQIAAVAKEGSYDLIFTGKETIDYNGSAIGGMVAELLDLPYVSLATKFDINGTTATITREIEGGEETCEVSLPVVISCEKGVAEQRIPNMKGIMGARTKPLTVKEPVAAEALTSIAGFELPPPKAGVKLISADNPEELVRLLHEEAKVI